MSSAGAVGLLVGPSVGSLVSRAVSAFDSDLSVSAPFLAMSALALVAALTIGSAVPEVSRRDAQLSDAVEGKRDRAVRPRLLAIGFVTALAIGGFEVGLALRGRQVLGLGAYQIGMMFTECSLVMLLAQTLGLSPLVSPAATRRLFTPGLVILALALAAVPWATGYVSTLFAVGAVAASAGVLSPIVTYWISLEGGKAQGSALGQQTAAASLGQTLGSVAAGLLFNVSIVPNAAFTAVDLVVVAAITASIVLPARLAQIEPRRSTGAPP